MAFTFSSSGETLAAARVAGNASLESGITKFPHEDLNKVRQPIVYGGQLTVQKNMGPANLLQGSPRYQFCIFFERFTIQASSLLIKDYLSHIYPSHNFW